MNLPPTTSAALDEFASRARTLFDPRLAQLVLYGSHARGEATEDSDVDVLVVVKDANRSDGREIDALVGDILTKLNVLVSALLLSSARFDELRARERRLIAEIERDGIPV